MKELELTIKAWEEQKERGTLTDSGLNYLSGLKRAYDMVKKEA